MPYAESNTRIIHTSAFFVDALREAMVAGVDDCSGQRPFISWKLPAIPPALLAQAPRFANKPVVVVLLGVGMGYTEGSLSFTPELDLETVDLFSFFGEKVFDIFLAEEGGVEVLLERDLYCAALLLVADVMRSESVKGVDVLVVADDKASPAGVKRRLPGLACDIKVECMEESDRPRGRRVRSSRFGRKISSLPAMLSIIASIFLGRFW